MTTLLDDRGALVVRCDGCRRLWPVTRERLAAVWESDEARDLHRWPVCVRPGSLASQGESPAADALREPIG
jgi:hypothetical protein